MSPRTLFLSRLIGLYCILVALSMISRKQATVETVTALVQNSSMMLILGVITLAAGLAMVLAHNIWSGGALVVVVTIVGWISLIRACCFCSLRPRWNRDFSLGSFTTSSSSTCTELSRSSWASTLPTVDSRQGHISQHLSEAPKGAVSHVRVRVCPDSLRVQIRMR